MRILAFKTAPDIDAEDFVSDSTSQKVFQEYQQVSREVLFIREKLKRNVKLNIVLALDL